MLLSRKRGRRRSARCCTRRGLCDREQQPDRQIWHATTLAARPNRLFYGDNLDVLRQHVANESVDLVYLDPPFNSNASYNVLFAERDGTQAAAQIKAFEDTYGAEFLAMGVNLGSQRRPHCTLPEKVSDPFPADPSHSSAMRHVPAISN